MLRHCALLVALAIASLGCRSGDAALDVGVTCSAESPSALAACVDEQRYAATLDQITGEERHTGGSHWQATQDLCRTRLEQAGFEVELHEYEEGIGVNVIGRRVGSTHPEQVIVVAAHYDAVAPDCGGADANASGIAGVLEVGEALRGASFERTLVAACFDEHEIGLIGTKAWVAEQVAQDVDIRGVFDFEMIAYASNDAGSQSTGALDVAFPNALVTVRDNEYRADFVTVVQNSLADEHAELLGRYVKAVPLRSVTLRVAQKDVGLPVYSTLTRGDHSPFWFQGFPAVMVTDTGPLRNPNYHCSGGEDTFATLNTSFASTVVRATTATVAHVLGVQGLETE